jgi:hypothetical protein
VAGPISPADTQNAIARLETRILELERQLQRFPTVSSRRPRRR